MQPSMPLPEGARVLHIGPHKTGSTAIQDAMHQARDDMLAQGVRYVSITRHPATAARYVTGRLAAGQDEATARQRWTKLVSRMRDPGPERKVFSSEFLSDATDEQVERIIGDLGADCNVVITLRPLVHILPSQYQQYVQRGSTFPYDEWLDGMLNVPPYDRPTPTFWQRHRHDELVRRWARLVGPERVIAVMLDSRDFTVAPRAFEQLLGLAAGTLTGQQVRANRSLTWSEVEVMRRFNFQFKDAGLSPELHMRLVKPAMNYLKERTPGPGEPRIVTPGWAVARANEVGAQMATAIEALGAQVIGDLSLLSSASGPSGQTEPPTDIDVEIAARLAAGFAISTDLLLGETRNPAPSPQQRPAADQAPPDQAPPDQAAPPAPGLSAAQRVARRGKSLAARMRGS